MESTNGCATRVSLCVAANFLIQQPCKIFNGLTQLRSQTPGTMFPVDVSTRQRVNATRPVCLAFPRNIGQGLAAGGAAFVGRMAFR